MLTASSVASRPDFSISAVTCRSDHTRWSALEVRADHRVVLVRRGRFRRRAAGDPADIDATLAYVGAPGEEESFAHPTGGDVCTSISVTPKLWRSLAGDAEAPAAQAVYVDPHLDLAHRRMLAAARSGDIDYALCEELLALLSTAIGRTATGPTPLAPTPFGRDRPLVAAAREAITAAHPSSDTLFSLAELLGVSPYRLSRAFPRELGVTVTHYRQRVRIGRALDRLEAGENSLSTLAADLGYADQAHLTRTMRQYLGSTPTALRRLLTPAQ
ncbi:helix-turn-helix transcriptional regulator [Streptomyces sp. ISL-36]|uniref:helix-turn-helix domain-containing protein n=1 Tax=Streptomyces sp. ISL-36 TaxID=2819182 RepID=UPI001BE8D35E|nr:AraC family transcriptional regulator [Streptomyces sp. ISL-36]MBT2445378.1 helix-turn-helix transcriptional regulator [Streptomyces sp. ISL-36]